MNESDKISKKQRSVDDAAAEWVVRRDRGLSAREQDGFFQWLAEDPSHGERYAYFDQSWKDASLLAEWCPEHSDEPNPDLLQHSSRTRWMRWGSGLMALSACVALVALAAFGPLGSANRAAETQSSHYVANDYLYQVLIDGSELDMNEGSEVEVVYSAERRLVRLISGEVHFKVAKNPERPFVVLAGDTEVKAIGTAFNVRSEGDALEVLVTEGIVRWGVPRLNGLGLSQESRRDRGDSVPALDEGMLEIGDSDPQYAFHQDLVSGQKSRMELSNAVRTPPVVETVDPTEMKTLLRWKHELLEFDATPLASAIEQFNFRNDIKLVIEDESLGDIPIVASFRSDNVGGFVRLLELATKVQADYSREGEILLRRSSP